MSKRSEYRTRDPKPVSRDPVVEPGESNAEPLPRLPSVIALRVPLVRCTRCGHSTMRKGGGTRPNYSTGDMARRWECAHCGQRFCVFSEPTEQELAEHWGDK